MRRGRCGAEFVDLRGKTSRISWGLGHRMSVFLAQERHKKKCGYNNIDGTDVDGIGHCRIYGYGETFVF